MGPIRSPGRRGLGQVNSAILTKSWVGRQPISTGGPTGTAATGRRIDVGRPDRDDGGDQARQTPRPERPPLAFLTDFPPSARGSRGSPPPSITGLPSRPAPSLYGCHLQPV